MENLFFESGQSMGRTVIMTILGYFSMVIILRVSGKRTLSKMNAFDFVITVALGSSLATVALNKNIALIDGILVFFLFIFLQYFITWLSVRVRRVKKIVTNQPTMLLYKGKPLEDVMKKERIAMEEIYLSARSKGITDLSDIDVIVLETTGDLTIVTSASTPGAKTLKDVQLKAEVKN